MYRLLIMSCLLILFSLPTRRALTQGTDGTDAPASTAESTATPTSPRATITPVSTAEPQIVISVPAPGQAVQGKFTIMGTSSVIGFQSAELSFSYAENPTDTWFLIFNTEEAVSAGSLAEWDTTNMTDGEYALRLVVTLENGTQLSSIVPGLRVRNYTPIETSTPTPVTPTTVSELEGTNTFTPTHTPHPPTSTPFPPNPAQVSNQDLAVSFTQGALLTMGAFALGGLYIVVRKLRSHR